MTYDQAEFEIRCEWGEHGVAHLAPSSEVVIIVDVFSFSTSVDLATSQGAIVYPYRWRDASAQTFAASVGAELAARGHSRYTLSPSTLMEIPAGTRLVLPSPNGATLTLGTGPTCTLAGCLRNSQAVAAAARQRGAHIAVIPAGEQWPDGRLRPAVEDWLGAGAILSHLGAGLSPEAQAAVAAFQAARRDLLGWLTRCSSGREKRERGRQRDIELAAALNASGSVPVLVNGAYQLTEA